MITDNLTWIGSYRGLSVNLDKAIAFIERTDISTLQPGRTEIAGADLYYTVSDNELVGQQELYYEAHRLYVDIQLVVEGHERIYWQPLQSSLTASADSETIAYDKDRDVLFFKSDGGSSIDLGAGDFCVFFPHDAHKPRCKPQGADSPSVVRKIVFKVRISSVERPE